MEVVSPQQILGQQIANSQIAQKILGPSAIRKSPNCHSCGRSANVTHFVSPQLCGFSEVGVR